jgi:hypothetical protein
VTVSTRQPVSERHSTNALSAVAMTVMQNQGCNEAGRDIIYSRSALSRGTVSLKDLGTDRTGYSGFGMPYTQPTDNRLFLFYVVFSNPYLLVRVIEFVVSISCFRILNDANLCLLLSPELILT